jgi:hypothetical protein
VSRLLARLPWLALTVMSLVAIGGLLVPAPARLASPLEFGYGDGLMLDHAVRVASGQRLYVEPTLHFITLAYMPLYTYVVAPLVALFGPHLWTGRLVSLLASLVAAALIGWMVRRESRSALLGLAGAGLFLMGQGFSRGSYDTFRPDPLMLLLVVAGLVTLRLTRGLPGAAASALLLALAFFTKQHAACFGVAALLHLLWNDRRRLPVFALTLVLACGGGFFLLTRVLGPWFSFYVYDVPSHWSTISRARIQGYLGGELFGRFALLSLPVVLSLALPERPWRGPSGLWWWMGLGGLATGLLATLDPYAFYHVLMPTLTALAVVGPLALQRITQRLAPAPSEAGGAMLAALLAVQFVALLYPVRAMLPTRGASAIDAAHLARLRAFRGRVIEPSHGFFAYEAGKGTALHTLPLDDIVRARGNRLLKRDPAYFERMFDSLRVGPDRPVLITDTPLEHLADASAPLWATLVPYYRRAGDLGPLSDQLRPHIGYRGAPTLVYEPVEPGAAAAPDSARASDAEPPVPDRP